MSADQTLRDVSENGLSNFTIKVTATRRKWAIILNDKKLLVHNRSRTNKNSQQAVGLTGCF